uniref:Uncharacterized protein n=1 Tax=Arundo donax TaxID=35708 RepID=A0A0A9D4C8_ARUDO
MPPKTCSAEEISPHFEYMSTRAVPTKTLVFKQQRTEKQCICFPALMPPPTGSHAGSTEASVTEVGSRPASSIARNTKTAFSDCPLCAYPAIMAFHVTSSLSSVP